jgi:hypothetical protein
MSLPFLEMGTTSYKRGEETKLWMGVGRLGEVRTSMVLLSLCLELS